MTKPQADYRMLLFIRILRSCESAPRISQGRRAMLLSTTHTTIQRFLLLAQDWGLIVFEKKRFPYTTLITPRGKLFLESTRFIEANL